MKLSKVLLGSAIALSLVFGFAGCSDDDDEEGAFSGKTVDFDNSYIYTKTDSSTGAITVEHATAEQVSKNTKKDGYENNGLPTKNETYYYRAFKKLLTKHYGSTCVITLTPKTDGIIYDATNSNTAANGVAGFVFDMTENSDGTYNFIIVSLKWDASVSKLKTYISKFTNALIKDNNFSDKSNFTDVEGTEITTTANSNKAVEDELLKGLNGTYAELSDFTVNADGNVVVAIKVEQNSTSGDYTVSYYTSYANAQSGTSPSTISSYSESDSNVTLNTKETTVTISNDATIKDGYKQEKMAMYANVYSGQHLYADFAFKDTVGNDIPFEEDIIEE